MEPDRGPIHSFRILPIPRGTNMKKTLATASLAALLAVSLLPDASWARHHYYRHTYAYRSDCNTRHHHAANTGTVIGAVTGGILGSQIAGRGNRTGGTLIGAGVGAVAGHHIGAHSHRC